MKLHELQALFTDDVTASHGDHPDALVRNVRETRGVGAVARLDIYRSNVVGIHLKALDDTFPVVSAVLGVRYWHQLLQAEIMNYASANYDLNSYGVFVPKLLESVCTTHEELFDFPYLSDLAKLEVLAREVMLRKDNPSFNWDRYQELSPEAQSTAQLVVNSTLSLFRSDYPVDALWYAHQDTLPEKSFDDAPEGIVCCLYRDDQFRVSLERLSPLEVQLLEQLIAGTSLEKLQADESFEVEALIQTLFAWIGRGWVVDFTGTELQGTE